MALELELGLKSGQIVISKKGKDAGKYYVFSGIDENGRAKLIRPERFNISRPKKKNPAHIQKVNKIAAGLLKFIKAGKDIDMGFFNREVEQEIGLFKSDWSKIDV